MTTTNPPPTDLPPFKLPSEAQQTDLTHISNLLHLLHHRNHNQHRRSTWYRHFNLFRRNLQAILSSITTLQHTPSTHLARHEKKATDAKVELSVRQRLAFWRDVLVPKTHHAFSQVAADGRFAVLGVMLLACLSSVCRIFGLVAVYEQLGQIEVERVLEAFAQEGWDEDDGVGVLIPRSGEGGAGEDVGEVLRRDEDDDGGVGTDAETKRAKVTELSAGAEQKGCLAPEREVLKQSRDAMKQMAEKASMSPVVESPSRSEKKSKSAVKPGKLAVAEKEEKPAKQKVKKRTKEEDTAAMKPAKKKRKKNAIDDLFSGL